MIWLAVAVTFLFAAYLLFRDTMNRLQYVQTLRIYWITRNTAPMGTPVVSVGFMRQTSAPWWNGKGVQFRFKNYSFQVGVLTERGDGLIGQLGGRDMDETASEIRSWN
jgi:hypothetical protein